MPENDLDQLGLPFCDCATGRAVVDATDNPGLVSDCEALLASRDTLAGDATLDWSADTPIAGWDGITLGGTPERVTQLRLIRRGLTGALPSELGSLTNLRMLVLWGNLLTGAIPSELGNLANLKGLSLRHNELSGAIPTELGGLANLERLYLDSNDLSGAIPTELASLVSLQLLDLAGNELSGLNPCRTGQPCQSDRAVPHRKPFSRMRPRPIARGAVQ